MEFCYSRYVCIGNCHLWFNKLATLGMLPFPSYSVLPSLPSSPIHRVPDLQTRQSKVLAL